MSIINNGLLLASGADAAVGYQISRSLRFNSADSAYLSRTPGSAGNQQTWTLSMWVKRSKLGSTYRLFDAYTSASDTGYTLLGFSNEDKLIISGWSNNWKITTQVFRDVSAWYHIVVAFDVTQATGSNRIKFYVNGTQITAFDTDVAPAQNTNHAVNGAIAHAIGRYSPGPSQYFDGYIADVYLLDGTATTPSTFAETDAITGQWVPKTPTGISYGTNGFRLPFSDNSGTTSTTLGKDAAGSNNWTPNNFSVASGSGNDSLVDSPTSYGTDTGAGGEVRGNYATFNPLNVQIGAGSLSNGNLDLTGPSGSSAYNYAGGTFGIDTSTSTGWYFEFTQTTYGQFASIGLLDQSVSASALNNLYIIGHSFANQTAGISYSNGGSIGDYGTLTTGLTSWTSSGDVIGVAIKDNKIWFAKNNTWISGSPSAGTSPSITLASTKYVTPAAIGINSSVLSLNAGQRAFAYTAPSGFKALCDTNLTAPTIAKPANYFDVKLYTGNGTSQTVSGYNFGPELVWIKVRNTTFSHQLWDAIRGTNKLLSSDSTAAEISQTGGLTAFNSDGFSVGDESPVNSTNRPFVAWAWDAASSNSTNTQGSITSTVRANATAGFSIVTYTGTGANATVGHGCGAAPSMMLVKSRSAANGWAVYHASIGNTYELILNSTSAVSGPNGTYWNSTSPTSTVFSLGTDSWGNANGGTYVAYCFAPVAGYSAFGSYTGDGSTSGFGPFVHCGFRPKFVLIKGSSVAYSWLMFDSVRNPYNLTTQVIYADASTAEMTNNGIGSGGYESIDILSNGFQIKSNSSRYNQSSATYVYMALAESPFQYARAR